MTKSNEKASLETLIENARSYIKEEDLDIIKEAYYYAEAKHDGQLRKSGEEYIVHPLSTAIILSEIYADKDTICAGLLHDVIEDCDTTKQDIAEHFGDEIASLVDGVTKISKIRFSTENEALIEYYKKIIVGMSEDVRVIIIKLADRLHNMRTLWALSLENQKKIAKETLEILTPIAHHLGIYKIKSELEDLSLRYLKPDVFYDIAEKLNNTKLERDQVVGDMLSTVQELLNAHNIPHQIKGRSKSIYSIYKKLGKGKKFSDIYDLLALRVLVDTEQECYSALGIIHSKYRPIPKRFKDYIAMPKPNGYQSLHTTVFGIDGYLFEIQIRTYSMDEVAENGIASHWAYKENKTLSEGVRTSTEAKLEFFKSIIELNDEKMSSEDFVNSVRDDLLNNNIYCFTPKGDVIELPVGATPLDFAYRIHTRVGETTVGAIVNNNIVPLNYELKSNDIVKINTNKSSTPSKEWINMVKTTQARNKIKSFFTKNEREVYIERGKEALEKELRKRKLPFGEFFTDENIKTICEEINADDLDEIYLMVGNGRSPVNAVINIIDKPTEAPAVKNIKITSTNTDADIIVTGIDKIKVNLANCCNPVYGDEIIGYITKGNGISVHRMNCHNLEMLEDRTLEVSWGTNANKRYLTALLIYTNTSENHMLDLMQSISMQNVSVDEIKVISKVDNIMYEVGCYVTGLDQLNKVIMNLNKMDFVDRIERVMR